MKRNKAREKQVKEKLRRIKEGKFKSEEERNMFSQLLHRGSGTAFSVKIGLKNVFKKSHWKKTASRRKESVIKGEKLLQKYNIPVTRYNGTTKIYSAKKKKMVEYLEFEKARDLTEKETKERMDEIINITIDASKKGIFIDPCLRNFGINSKGKIIIRDTDRIREVTKKMALESNLGALESSLERKFTPRRSKPEKIEEYLKIRKSIKEKLEKIRKQKGIK